MSLGTRYLATSALRALITANARTPVARTGPLSIPAFLSGWPASELPLQHAAAFGASAAVGIARGVHRSRAGKAGLALTAAAAAGLYKLHRDSQAAGRIVELALADELGHDYASQLAKNPLEPRTGALPVLPTPRVRARYVTEGHIAYDEYGRRTTLDVWKRPDLPADGKAPVLVQIHGGGWVLGDKEGQAYPLMVYLAERGWICVSVTYRLSPRATWPAHIHDVKRAIAWVKENIAGYGGDPDWVALTGGSAGGHLCALAALTPNDPQFQPGLEDADTSVRAAVPFYGVYDWTNRDGWVDDRFIEFLERRVVQAKRTDGAEVFEQASPMAHISPDSVPFMFLHGSHDTLVPVEIARLTVDLMRKESQQSVVYVEFPGAQHAFDTFSSPRARASVVGAERFLNHIRARDGHA